MATPVPAKVTITRTPLAGGEDRVLSFDYDAGTPAWVSPFTIRRSLSVGPAEVDLTLDNEGLRFDDWEQGDLILIEAQGALDAPGIASFSGFVAEISDETGVRNFMEVRLLSLREILEAVVVTTDEVYSAVAWTDIADDLITTYLPGVAKDITADAATATVTITAGTTLKAALDHVRHGLVAATGDRWEADYHRDAGTPTLRLFKRDADAKFTIGAEDLVEPLRRNRGSIFDVANRVVVEGPSHTAQRDDAASQAKYANLVPNGVLALTRKDDFLVTQDMVDAEAESLLAVRKNAQPSIEVVLPLRQEIVEGSRVELDAELVGLVGLAVAEYDVVEVGNDIGPTSTTTLTLGERRRRRGDASKTVAEVASGRTL